MNLDSRLRLGARPLAYWGAGRRTRQRAGLLIDSGFPPDYWIDIDPRKIGMAFNGAEVVGPDRLEDPTRPFVLVYVTNHGARELIAARLNELGYTRGADYLAVG